jgi:protein-S-isoprenylcysteine O-methyltransferase Ste14
MTAPLFFKNLVFTVLVPGTFGVYLPMAIAHRTGAKAQAVGPLWFLGLALLALGTMIYLLCVIEFAGRGQGTPAPIDPPRALVVSGLYRYVRNPMYLGVLCVVLGLTSLTGSTALLAYAGGLWLMFEVFILLYEEPALRREFGEAYVEYCTQVRRWIPRREMRT